MVLLNALNINIFLLNNIGTKEKELNVIYNISFAFVIRGNIFCFLLLFDVSIFSTLVAFR